MRQKQSSIHILATFFSALAFSLSSSAAAEKPNILLICVDDLRPELPSFGKKYIHAPHMEKLAKQGRLFKRHYVQAPTCGASRYALLTGKYPIGKFANNGAIGKHDHQNEPSFPALLKQNGYTTMAIGKVSHHPGGFMGTNWNDKTKPEMPGAWDYLPECFGIWKHPMGQMHGIADGTPRTGGGKTTPVMEAKDASYPDDPTVATFEKEIATLAKQDKPWLCAVGLLRPHLPFACPKKFLDLYKPEDIPDIPAYAKPRKGDFWHGSGEFMKYQRSANPNEDAAYAKEVIRYYAACVSYADDSVGKILAALDSTGQADNTVVILWGDHGWHLGEQKIWGKHSPYAVALHAPLIIKIPGQKEAGIASEQLAETVDLYPTICDLTGAKTPAFTQGKSLLPIVHSTQAKSDGEAISYWKGQKSVITANEHKVTKISDGTLTHHFDLTKDPHEQKNLVPASPAKAKTKTK